MKTHTVTSLMFLGWAECFFVSPAPLAGRRSSFASWNPIRTDQQLAPHLSSGALDVFQVALTVPEANAILTPVFITSALPCVALVYFLNEIKSFPRGATCGFACFLVAGLLAGPVELFSQKVYGVSFFDCDWIHGTVSSFFALGTCVANVSLLKALRQETEPGYGPSLRFYAISASLVLAIAASEYWSGLQVHSPHWFGVLDTAALPNEPANALSVATWLIHVLEISQFQVLLRLISRWAQTVSSTGEEPTIAKELSWGLVPLQFSNVAIIGFHLFYNALTPIYVVFGILLLFGNTSAALVARKVAAVAPQRRTEGSALPSVSSSVDGPFIYGIKLVSFAFVSAYLVKFGSLLVNLPAHINTVTSIAMTLPALVFVVWDLRRIDSGL